MYCDTQIYTLLVLYYFTKLEYWPKCITQITVTNQFLWKYPVMNFIQIGSKTLNIGQSFIYGLTQILVFTSTIFSEIQNAQVPYDEINLTHSIKMGRKVYAVREKFHLCLYLMYGFNIINFQETSTWVTTFLNNLPNLMEIHEMVQWPILGHNEKERRREFPHQALICFIQNAS